MVAVDLLGHGDSEAPANPARYSVSAMVADLLEVLDTLRIPSATWIGYSMGGRVALAAAILRAERVRGLVLESASPGLAEEAERRRRRADDEALAQRIEHEGLEAFAAAWEQLPLFASRARLPEATRAALRRRLLANRPEGLAACLRGLGVGAQPSFWDDLLHVSTPTLLAVGALDGKFRGIAEEMRRRLPESSATVVPDAGHAVHLERPAEWLDVVRPWLGGGR